MNQCTSGFADEEPCACISWNSLAKGVCLLVWLTKLIWLVSSTRSTNTLALLGSHPLPLAHPESRNPADGSVLFFVCVGTTSDHRDLTICLSLVKDTSGTSRSGWRNWERTVAGSGACPILPPLRAKCFMSALCPGEERSSREMKVGESSMSVRRGMFRGREGSPFLPSRPEVEATVKDMTQHTHTPHCTSHTCI